MPATRAVIATALAATILCTPAAAQRIFYVDHQSGNDSANGLSEATAWKHGPGDARSTGVSRLINLTAGDTVRFRGGVRYRGSMSPRAVGTPQAPVILDGSGWGNTRAIIDGSDPLTGIRRCQSAADCLGSPHWANLWRADVPADSSWTDWLFVNDIAMQPAQYPSLAMQDADKPARYLTIPKAATAQLQAGSVSYALPADLARGAPVLALWVQPNTIAFTSDVRVSTSGLEFAGAQWIGGSLKPYTNRDNKFSLMNAPAMVNRAGLFATSPKDGVVIFWPPSGVATPNVTIGSNRLGFNMSRASHTLVRGFSFTSFAGEPGNLSSGGGILMRSSNPGLAIADNSFRSFASISSLAAVHVAFARDLRVERNQFTQMPWTKAILVDNTKGPVLIACNQLSDIGGTGIRFNNVANGSIRGNSLTRLYGMHANAISAYNDSRNVVIADNVVTASMRPLTVHGPSTLYHDAEAGTPGVAVTGNVFISTSSADGGVVSYGKTQNFVLTDNFIASPRFSLKLIGTETNFIGTGNTMVGAVSISKKVPIFDPAQNTMHAVDGNGLLLTEQMKSSTVRPGVCA